MQSIRAFFLRYRGMAIVLVMAALCMKVLVPAGYMIGQNSRILTVQICQDGLGEAITKQIAIPMTDDAGDSTGQPGKGDCPFSTLSMASLSGADAALLAIALAFILALGISAARQNPVRQFSHLRPPLRGPPALV
jgi:hypothetical protein